MMVRVPIMLTGFVIGVVVGGLLVAVWIFFKPPPPGLGPHGQH